MPIVSSPFMCHLKSAEEHVLGKTACAGLCFPCEFLHSCSAKQQLVRTLMIWRSGLHVHTYKVCVHADPASPEGVAADATAYWGETAAQSPDVIINVSADNTAAFSAWAMGTRAPRCSLADLTGVPCPLRSR